MRTFKVKPEICRYLRKNLLNAYYSCRFFADENGNTRCKTNASSDTFHKMVIQSRCDLDSEESGLKHVPDHRLNVDYFLNGSAAVAVSPITAEYYL